MNFCQRCRAQLGEFLDGTLSASARENVAAHLATCADCAREKRAIEATRAALNDMQPLPAPPEIRLRVRAALQQEAAQRQKEKPDFFSGFNLLRPHKFAWAGTMTLSAIALLLLAKPFSQTLPTAPQSESAPSSDFAPRDAASSKVPSAPSLQRKTLKKVPAPKANQPTATPTDKPKDLPEPVIVPKASEPKIAAQREISPMEQSPSHPANTPKRRTASPTPNETLNINGLNLGPAEPSPKLSGSANTNSTAPVSSAPAPLGMNMPTSSVRNRIMITPDMKAAELRTENKKEESFSIGITAASGLAKQPSSPMASRSDDAPMTTAGALPRPIAPIVPNMAGPAADVTPQLFQAPAAPGAVQAKTAQKAAPEAVPDATMADSNTGPNGRSALRADERTKPETESAFGGKSVGDTDGVMAGGFGMSRNAARGGNGGFGGGGPGGGGFGSGTARMAPAPIAPPAPIAAPAMVAPSLGANGANEAKPSFPITAPDSARIFNLNVKPPRDVKKAQIRVVLPPTLRFETANASNTKVVWRGDFEAGHTVQFNLSLRGSKGGEKITVYLEQNSGDAQSKSLETQTLTLP